MPLHPHPDLPLILHPLLQILSSPSLHTFLLQPPPSSPPPISPSPFQTRMTVHRTPNPPTSPPSAVFKATYLFQPVHTSPPTTFGTALLVATESDDSPSLPPTHTTHTLNLSLRFIHDASTRAFMSIAPIPALGGYLVHYSRQESIKYPAYTYRAVFDPSIISAYNVRDLQRALRMYLITRQHDDTKIPSGIEYLGLLSHASHASDMRMFLSSICAEFGVKVGETVQAGWKDGRELWRRSVGSATLRFEKEGEQGVGNGVVGWAVAEFRKRRVENARAELMWRLKREERKERNRQAAKRSWERKKERESAMAKEVEDGRAKVAVLRKVEMRLRMDNLKLRQLIREAHLDEPK